jgi:hypothetical protein
MTRAECRVPNCGRVFSSVQDESKRHILSLIQDPSKLAQGIKNQNKTKSTFVNIYEMNMFMQSNLNNSLRDRGDSFQISTLFPSLR